MAENNWPDEREMKGMLDFGEYNTKDDNTKYGTRKLNLKLCHKEILKVFIFCTYMKYQTLGTASMTYWLARSPR